MSESFGERLRRVRKEPPSAPAAHVERAALPDWLRGRLARGNQAPRSAIGDPRCSVGPPVGLLEARNGAGAFAARVTRFALDHRHGAGQLGEVRAAERDSFALLTGDERLRDLDPLGALYLDIETTGLSGGAGTKAFLVGLGAFREGAFELWQGFLRGPEEEHALLLDCAERLRGCCGIVSFFGKSFDRHRLEDKMRMHGVAPPFDERAHLDLYHPCRRLYGGVFADQRLSTLERELCGVERDRDLPGSFAPAAWYDFLSGRPHLLEEVFRHNRDDVLSLVTLASHLGRVQAPAPMAAGLDTGPLRREAARCAALAWATERAGRWSECARWAAAAEALLPSATQARELLALCAKALERSGATLELEACLERLASEARDAFAARAAWQLAGLSSTPALAKLHAQRALELASEAGLAALARRAERLLASADARTRKPGDRRAP